MLGREWSERYREAVARTRMRIERVRGIVLAYGTCIDGVHHLKIGEIEEIFRKEPELEREVLEKLERPPGVIESEADFLAGLVTFMKAGKGGEWAVLDKPVSDWIRTTFGYDELRIGACGTTTNVLGHLGIPFIVPHVCQLPRRLAGLFAGTGNIFIPRIEDDHIVFKSPMDAARPDDEEVFHSVFEFTRGLRVQVASETVEAPSDDRFISSRDERLARLEIPADFREGVLSAIERIDKVILADYHLLRRRYDDGSTHVDKLRSSVEQVEEWKERNPNIKTHFELADITDPVVRRTVLLEISSVSDSLGLNKEQLADSLEVLGHTDMSRNVETKFSSVYAYDGLESLQERLKIAKITLHTREFSLSTVKPDFGISVDAVQDAMLFGTAASAVMAATGVSGSPEEIAKAIESPALHVSEVGMKQHEILAEELSRCGMALKDEFLKEGMALADDYAIVFTVSKTVENPVTTVGLGDCMTAGLVAGEVEV